MVRIFKLNGGVSLLTYAGIVFMIGLVLELPNSAHGLKCYHCVCRADCVENAHHDQQRTCPEDLNACFTEKGPGDQASKGCTKKGDKGTNGGKKHLCETDLCNGKNHAGGIGIGGGAGAFHSVSTTTVILMASIAIIASLFSNH